MTHVLRALVAIVLLPLPSHATPSQGQLSSSLSPAADLVQSAWQQYYQQLRSIRVDGQPLMSGVQGFMQYGFSLTPHQLQLAYINHAMGPRLKRLVRRQLQQGDTPLKIGVIGTSISWGTGPSARGTTDYASMIPLALQMAFPKAHVTSRNGCSPATGSGFANMCLSNMLDDDVDLIIMEFVTNDFVADLIWSNTHTITYERLVRKALNRHNHPVVMFVQLPSWGQMFNSTATTHKLWPSSAEVPYNALAQYYGIPTVSFRNAWWHDAESATSLAPEGWSTITAADLVHPNDLGHRSILDMIMWVMLQTTIQVCIHPLTKREAIKVTDPLPGPIYPGNYEEGTSLCMLEEQLKSVVDENRSIGWSLINEGTEEKKKIGFLSNAVNSELFISLDLGAVLGFNNGAPRSDRVQRVGVALAYLQSYTNMGQAVWSCKQGCVCEDRVLDAYHTQKTSTSFVAVVSTEAIASVCHITLRILPTTNSGGHKFKVNGIMVSPMDQMGFHWPSNHSAEWRVVELLRDGNRPEAT